MSLKCVNVCITQLQEEMCVSTKDPGGKKHGPKERKLECFLPNGFSLDYWKIPLIQKKKDKYTILPMQTRDGSFLKILCAKKSLGHPLPFYKQSKTGQEELGELGTSRMLNVPESVTKITQTQSVKLRVRLK